MSDDSFALGANTECPECGGRGWIVVPDGGNGTARACACRGRDRMPRLFQAAHIPDRYRSCRLATFDRAHPKPAVRDQLLRAFRETEVYVDEFVGAGGRFRESGLLFVGPPGVGKTHLAVAVLAELIERYGVHGRFVNLTDLIQQLQMSFDGGSEDSRREILGPLLRAEMLVLDELGARQPTPWVLDLLYFIVNARYNERRATIFTTNYRVEPAAVRREARSLDRGADREAEPRDAVSLGSRLPAPLVSRICEMAKPIDLTAVTDFRREVLMHGRHS